MIPGSANPLLLASAGYAISRSVRLNSADSAYLSRTPASAGNRKTWTLSLWAKRSKLGGSYQVLISNSDSSAINGLYCDFTSDYFQLAEYGASSSNWNLQSAAVYRDTSAWYHIVCAVDTTQATASDRVKIWINGERITSFYPGSETYPTLNYDTLFNTTALTAIGRFGSYASSYYYDGYLADVHFIDGQALDPTSFGEFDDNGIWQPIAYTGTYPGNSFHLDFSDNSTAGSLGDDSSGNNNDWTPNNLSTGIAGNTSQNWSATASIAGQSGFEATKAFDGDASSSSSTYYFPGTDGTGTFTFAQSMPYSTIKIWYGRNNGRLFVNGVDMVVGSTSYAELTQIDLAAKGVSSPLVSIGLERTGVGNGAYLFGVEVNGSQLVDPAYSAVNDSLVDVPTNGTETDTGLGGEVRGNYCTWNPLKLGSGYTLSNGNLEVAGNGPNLGAVGTIGFSGGKWYWEITVSSGANQFMVALGITSNTSSPGDVYAGSTATNGWGWRRTSEVLKSTGNITINNTPSAYTDNDVLQIAFDADAGKVWLGKNGTWTASGNPAAGTTQTLTYTASEAPYFPVTRPYNGASVANFGQRPFAYTAPSGFKSLNTASLPAPVVTKPSQYMDVVTYTGNGGTQTISGLEFSPDLVWIKSRSNSFYHRLYDTIRGTTKALYSNTTETEGLYQSDYENFTAFNSDGFSLGSTSLENAINKNNSTFAAWCWDAGSSTVTNTDGSITSSVRANASAGFSVVSYSGTISGSAPSPLPTVGHGLGIAPQLVISKSRNNGGIETGNWFVWHASAGTDNWLRLNTTDAAGSISGSGGGTMITPTSTVFSTPYISGSNISGATYVAYCFAPVSGYSSSFSYTGNGASDYPNADGPFVYLGFKPRFILIKCSSAAENWVIYDAARSDYNYADDQLYPNLSNAEATGANREIDILSNGFKVRSNGGIVNTNTATYVGFAVAESPFQYARAR